MESVRRVYVGGKNARIELTVSLPSRFDSVWPYCFLGATLNALFGTILSEGFGLPILPMFQVELISLTGSLLELMFVVVGVLSLCVTE